MWTSFENWACEKKDYYERKTALGRSSLLARELLFQLREWKGIKLKKQNLGTCKRTSTPFFFQVGQLTTIMGILAIECVIESMKCEGIVDVVSNLTFIRLDKPKRLGIWEIQNGTS